MSVEKAKVLDVLIRHLKGILVALEQLRSLEDVT